MAYNKLIDLNLLSNFLSKIKSLIPTKTSDLENDSEYITGMEILSYGNSTWNDFLTAYTAKKVVYCRASSNSNPASGSQTRLAFMAYVNNADNPTNVEFQYYRSVSSHTNTQQGDQVFVYKLDKTSGWSVTTREASSKIVAGTNLSSSYSNDTLTLNANIPSNISDLTNDSGYITGITSSDVTTALGYTPSSTDTTYSAGNGIDITNTIIKNTQGIEYIVGTQTAATAVWTGNSTDEALYIGKIIAYYLPYAGTSTAATLTLTMKNGATTEAIRLLRVGSNTITTQFAANNVIILIYDGTYWRVSAYYDSDTNTVPTGYCATGASTVAKSATCTYGYRDDTNYFPCLFRYANTAANATLAIASYATTALPIYVNGERTSATNTFGRGVILFLYYDGAYYCYNDGRLPILVDGVVTSVQDYTNELKNTISEISQVITSTDIDSTPIATFDASAANMPLKNLTVNIEPVQDFNGYDSPWPGGSRKNLLNIDDLITAPSGTFGGYTFKHKLTLIVSPNTQYTLSTSYNDTGNVLYFNGTSGSGNCVKTDAPKTFQSSEAGELTILLYDRDGISSFENKTVTVQLEEGSTATTYEPYENICPITGWTGCRVFYPGLDITRGLSVVLNKYINTSGVETDSGADFSHTDYFPVTPGTTLYFSSYQDELPASAPSIAFYNANKVFVSPRQYFYSANQYKGVIGYNFATVTVPSDCVYAIFNFSYSIRERYVLTDKDPTITFPSTLGTVYGGTFDVANKKLIIDKGIVDLGDLTWGKITINNKYYYRTNIDNMAQMASRTMPVMSTQFITISDGRDFEDCPDQSIYNLDVAGANVAIIDLIHTSPTDFKTAVTGAMLIYPLASPIEIPITSAPDITTTFGENNIWADCGDVTVIYGEYLTQIKNNINDLDKRVKIIEDNDPLFDKLIHLPDDDSFFNKGTVTSAGIYTKLSKNSFSLSGGSGTTYYCYPLHGTNRLVTGSNTQLPTRLLATDFVEIPANGVWGNTTYSLGIQFYCEANTTTSNRNLELVLVCANIQNGEIVGTPEIINNYVTNNKEYGSTILRLRGFGYAPLERYTHYAIFARSRSRASSAVATINLKLVQSPRLLQYILYSGNVAETSLTATATHAPNSFILNNDRLYKVLTQIQSGEEIVIGTNVEQVSILEVLTSLLNNVENIPNTSSISNTGLISIKHDSTELFTIQLPLYNGGVSNGT